MLDLSSFSTAELKTELTKRREEPLVTMPSDKLDRLREAVRHYMDCVYKRDASSLDKHKHAIFEAAIETFYHEDIWWWINDNT